MKRGGNGLLPYSMSITCELLAFGKNA